MDIASTQLTKTAQFEAAVSNLYEKMEAKNLLDAPGIDRARRLKRGVDGRLKHANMNKDKAIEDGNMLIQELWANQQAETIGHAEGRPSWGDLVELENPPTPGAYLEYDMQVSPRNILLDDEHDEAEEERKFKQEVEITEKLAAIREAAANRLSYHRDMSNQEVRKKIAYPYESLPFGLLRARVTLPEYFPRCQITFKSNLDAMGGRLVKLIGFKGFDTDGSVIATLVSTGHAGTDEIDFAAATQYIVQQCRERSGHEAAFSTTAKQFANRAYRVSRRTGRAEEDN
uniref:Nonstructural protein n=1 Tax=Siamese algae-eater influenza-like virus TaxID=2777035 RepID=A0A866VZ02_9ORTO|nr:nonstructural protein [Siamese algae-eater influenza-like virus]